MKTIAFIKKARVELVNMKVPVPQAPGLSKGRSDILLCCPVRKRTYSLYWRLAISRIYLFIKTEKSSKSAFFVMKDFIFHSLVKNLKKFPPRKMHVTGVHVHYSKQSSLAGIENEPLLNKQFFAIKKMQDAYYTEKTLSEQ